MGKNLIVWVEGKYPLSPQGKNKWGTILSDERDKCKTTKCLGSLAGD